MGSKDVNLPTLVSKVPEGYREATAEEKLDMQAAGFRLKIAEEQKARWEAERDLASSQLSHCMAEIAAAKVGIDSVRTRMGVREDKDLKVFPDGTVCIKIAEEPTPVEPPTT